jgi:cytochrome P450
MTPGPTAARGRQAPPQYDEELHGLHNLARFEVAAEPWRYLRWLRDLPPVYWDPPSGVWVCTGYHEASRILRDWRTFPSVRLPASLPGQGAGDPRRLARLRSFFDQQLLFLDGAVHTELRRALDVRFARSGLTRTVPVLVSLVQDFLDPLPESGTIDLIGDFAGPLPTHLVAHLLGCDEEPDLVLRYSEASNRIIGNLSLLRHLDNSEAGKELEAARDFLLGRLRQETGEPMDNALGDLVRNVLSAAPGRFGCGNFEELLDLAAATGLVVLGGCYHTATHLISRGLLLLHAHPDQRELVRRDPAMLAGAVEETMRLDGPTAFLGRHVAADVTIAGQRLFGGDAVLILLGAANLDGREFENPLQFDVRRRPNRHLGFSVGSHHCLGARYATTMAQLAIGGFLQRYPSFSPSTEGGAVRWWHDLNVRCMSRMLVNV